MLNWLQNLGHNSLSIFESIGRSTIFLLIVLRGLDVAFARFRLTIREIYSVGVQSFLIIAVSGLFVGMVLGLQGYVNFAKFNAVFETYLGEILPARETVEVARLPKDVQVEVSAICCK